jgi:hypothetical protein
MACLTPSGNKPLFRTPTGFLISKPRSGAGGRSVPRRSGLGGGSGLRAIRAVPPPARPAGGLKKVGIAVIVVVILVGVFVVYQLETSPVQQSQAKQSSQPSVQEANSLQSQNVIGRTTFTDFLPAQIQNSTQYLTAGTNVTLQVIAIPTIPTPAIFGTFCYSLATPNGTWLVGKGESNLSCVNGNHYIYQFVAPETGNYTLFVQNPSSANSENGLSVTGIYFRS